MMKPFKFNPIEDLDLNIPKNKQKQALQAAASYLKEAMLDYIGEGSSPVSGGKWVRGLTKGYKDQKREFSSSIFANLEKEGDFLDSLKVSISGNDLVVNVGKDQVGKAEGFLTGLYGENAKKEYKREFMPQGDGKFNREIMGTIKSILEEYEDSDD